MGVASSGLVARTACGLLFASVAACNPEPRRQAARLLLAAEHFRRAQNIDKPQLIDEVRRTQCDPEPICRARELCLASFSPTADGLRRKAALDKALVEVKRGSLPQTPEALEGLSASLDEAEALLREGNDRLPPCDEALLALRRAYPN